MWRTALYCLGLANLSFLISPPAAADVITIIGDSRDGQVRDNGVSKTEESTVAAGRAGGAFIGDPVRLNSSIFFFSLSEIATLPIANVSFSVSLFQKQALDVGQHADLYALGFVGALPAIDNLPSSWYFSGENDLRSGIDLGTNIGSQSIVKVAEDFVTTATPLGTVSTYPSADALLTKFVQDLILIHGAGIDDFLVLRVNANSDFPETGTRTRYLFDSANALDIAARPALTVASVPEPSQSVFLFTSCLAAGISVVCSKRFRHRTDRLKLQLQVAQRL